MGEARRFEGKIALITGAGREGGIGEAIASRLVSEGAKVALVDLCRQRPELPRERFGSWEELQAVADRLSGGNDCAFPFKADVTSEAEVANLAADVVTKFGRIDLLFNNAGGGAGAGPVEMTPVSEVNIDDWDYTFDVSLKSTVLCSKHVSPIIARGGGAIVNTASISAHYGMAGNSAYAAAKLGVVALTRSLAMELAPKNIRVNAFSPGMTLTPYVRQRFERRALDDPQMTAEQHMARFTEASVPLRRGAEPSEMASVAAFLASPDASYMTGQTLVVDGGMRI